MFKKIEIWILYLVVALCLLFSLIPAFVVYSKYKYDKQIPLITSGTLFLLDIPVKINRIFKKEFTGFESKIQYNSNIKNSIFKSKNNFIGENLKDQMYLVLPVYNPPLKQNIIEIIDLTNFNIIKTIIPDWLEINSKIKNTNPYYKKLIKHSKRSIPNNPIITSDGGIIFNSGPIVKLNKLNEVEWINDDYFYHHGLNYDGDSTIWAPSRIYPSSISRNNKNLNFIDEGITALSLSGNIIFNKSLYEIFKKNGLEYKLFTYHGYKEIKNDPFHINDIEPITNDSNHWKKGDLFLSIRNLSMNILYRPSNDSIIWFNEGNTKHQHDIDILNQTSITIFDNNTYFIKNDTIVNGYNNIKRVNFETNIIDEYLPGVFKRNSINTPTQGSYTITDKGDILIEETDNGRILFLNKNGDLIWEKYNYDIKTDVFHVFHWSTLVKDKKLFNTIKSLNSEK